jgi:hypothetical protein
MEILGDESLQAGDHYHCLIQDYPHRCGTMLYMGDLQYDSTD